MLSGGSGLGPLFARLKSGRTLAFVAVVAFAGRFLCPAPPPRTLEGLAALLSGSSGGTVLPSDIVWEPSPGILAEFLWGRRVLFLSKSSDGSPRDLYRARVRITLEGRPVAVSGIHNLTATPFGDEHKLVISEEKAAFATLSYGKVESVTVLDLSGNPAAPESSIVDRMTWSITNWRETGTSSGIGRLDVNLDTPENDVTLSFDKDELLIGVHEGKTLAVDLTTGTLAGDAAVAGAHANATPALRKRPILWAVDTIRAEVGPEPVAMVEAVVFNARDLMRRSTYAVFGPSAEAAPVPSVKAAQPAVLDASYSQTDSSVWPPAPIPPIWKNPEPGEGTWEPVVYPWLKRLPVASAAATVTPAPGADADKASPAVPPPYFYRTMVRPDPDRPYAKVLVVAMDMRQLELDMEAGVEDPKPLTGAQGSGKIPRDPKILNRVVGAFNGAFKTTHGEYGMMVHRRILLPPKPGAATLIVSEDRRVGLGTWGTSSTIPSDVVSFRQNLEPLIQDGNLLPSGRTQWGWQLTGTSMLTERSGICVTQNGQLYYLWGDEVSAPTLGKAMILAGCTYGMHLDMNPHHTGFVFASVRSLANKDYDAKLLTQQMEIWPERYLEYSPKDFFYLMLRDPTPAGDVAWTEDVGTQPAPTWLPTVWRAMVQSSVGPTESQVQVELLAFDAGRVMWRVRPARQDGQKREYESSELGGDEVHRVVAAVGLGNPHDPRDTQNAKWAFSKLPVGGLTADETTGLALLSEADMLARGEKDDAIQLPLILDAGKIPPPAKDPRSMRLRGAACVTPGGHTVIAMATTDSDEAAALALARVGCTRAVSLDRGSHRPTFLHRAGGGSPPLARYDESVLYALSRPMIPRAYRWNTGAP
jgi:hypothetical protein